MCCRSQVGLGWVGQYLGEMVGVHSCLMSVLSVLLVVLSGLGLFFRVGLCLFIPPTPSGVWFGNPIVSVGWVHTYSKHCWYISPIAELGWGRLYGCRHLLVFISPTPSGGCFGDSIVGVDWVHTRSTHCCVGSGRQFWFGCFPVLLHLRVFILSERLGRQAGRL